MQLHLAPFILMQNFISATGQFVRPLPICQDPVKLRFLFIFLHFVFLIYISAQQIIYFAWALGYLVTPRLDSF